MAREYIRHAAVEEGFQGVWKLWSRLNMRISIPPTPPSVKAINVIIDFRASKGRSGRIYSLAPPSRQRSDNSFKNPYDPKEPFPDGPKRRRRRARNRRPAPAARLVRE